METKTTTMQQIIDFILEVEKLKGVTRKTRPLGLDRYENSAKHSWQRGQSEIHNQLYINNVTEPVTTSAAAHMKSRLNHAVRRSARPNLRYTTQAIRPVTAR
jgi:IS30 family transposase